MGLGFKNKGSTLGQVRQARRHLPRHAPQGQVLRIFPGYLEWRAKLFESEDSSK
jgi:hypothetical protein